MKRKWPIDILTDAEVQQLIDNCGRGITGHRNRALVACLAGSGLRIAEALALKPKDIDLDEREITFQRGKGLKRRTTVIISGFEPYLHVWAMKRKELALTGHQHFFCTISQGNTGGELSGGYVRNFLARLRKRAGITKRVHAHGLRHHFADRAHRQGLPVGYVQDLLGHSDIQTTAVYLNHLSNHEAVEAAKKLSR